MITGGAGATVFYNLKQKHPTLDMPVIDYDLALLFQPVLVLGISIGVVFNESARLSQLNDTERTEAAYEPLPGGPIKSNNAGPKYSNETGSLLENINWMVLGLLFTVWVIILVLEIAKNHTTTCSVEYWIFNLLQIPVALGVTSFQAVFLYKGKRVIASKGDQPTDWRVHQLILYCACGLAAGIVGGLLGLGGGFILGPLFLELGIPPQVSSATATFSMTFSASMSVVQYYLLKRFPIPYTLYFVAVSTVAAFVGQHLVKKLIKLLGRASLIIFILASTVFVSAISLGSVGIANMIKNISRNEYMGFDDLCTYTG
ncbi:Transmembrane protein [Sesbania bispinosa]|nr:Transmembrane protein [Sesbania bispinosa]